MSSHSSTKWSCWEEASTCGGIRPFYVGHESCTYVFLVVLFHTTAYLINLLPTPTNSQSSSFQLLFNKSPDYSFLRVFGCSYFPFLIPCNSTNSNSGLRNVCLLDITLHSKAIDVFMFHLAEFTSLAQFNSMKLNFHIQISMSLFLILTIPLLQLTFLLLQLLLPLQLYHLITHFLILLLPDFPPHNLHFTLLIEVHLLFYFITLLLITHLLQNPLTFLLQSTLILRL